MRGGFLLWQGAMAKASEGGSRLLLRPAERDGSQLGLGPSQHDSGEDAEMARALAASLASSADSGGPPLAMSSSQVEDDEDADLAAAIAASLGPAPVADVAAPIRSQEAAKQPTLAAGASINGLEADAAADAQGSGGASGGSVLKRKELPGGGEISPSTSGGEPHPGSGGAAVEGSDGAGVAAAASLQEGDEPEPAADAAGAMDIAVRVPEGRLQRRFLCTEAVLAAEAWLRRHGHDMQRHVLAKQWPRKVRLLWTSSGVFNRAKFSHDS